MSWKMALLAGAVSAVVPVAARAEVELSPQDLAYVAAQEIAFEQKTLESICGRSKFGKDVKRRHAEFVAANPEFTPALEARPTDPAIDARAQALIKRYQEGVGLVMRMAAGMPPEMFCPLTLKDPPTPFAARIENVRTQAARVDPPKPVDPDAGLAEVQLSVVELNAIVRQVLEHKDVAMYLHPELPERVPVRVALNEAYAASKLELALYGEPVRLAHASDRAAVQLTVRATDQTAKVTVAYAPEGIHGTIRFAREGTAWRVTEATIYE